MSSPTPPPYDDTPTTTRTHRLFEDFTSERERNGSEESPLLNNWLEGTPFTDEYRSPNNITFSPFAEDVKENWPDSFTNDGTDCWMFKDDKMRLEEVDVKESMTVEELDEFDLLANRDKFHSFSEDNPVNINMKNENCHAFVEDSLKRSPTRGDSFDLLIHPPSLECPSPDAPFSPSDFLNSIVQYPTEHSLNSSSEQQSEGTPSLSLDFVSGTSDLVSGASDLLRSEEASDIDLISRTSVRSDLEDGPITAISQSHMTHHKQFQSSDLDNLILDINSLNIGIEQFVKDEKDAKETISAVSEKAKIPDVSPEPVPLPAKPKPAHRAANKAPPSTRITRQQKSKTESPPSPPKSARIKRTMSADQPKPVSKPVYKLNKSEVTKVAKTNPPAITPKPTVESTNKTKKSDEPCCHRLHRKASTEIPDKKKPFLKAKTLPDRPKTAPVYITTKPKKGPLKRQGKCKDASLHRDIQPRSANTTPVIDPDKSHHHRITSANYSERKPLKKAGGTQTNEEISSLLDGLSGLKIEEKESGSKTALVYDERMALHQNMWSKNHPERPGRVEETMRVLNECGILKRVRTVCAREVTKDEALRCHSETLWTTIESLEEMKPRDLYRLTDEFDSVYFNNHSFLAAKLAAGSLMAVTDEVLSGRAHNGVAVIRPPGHHAETDKPMGFCLLGNVPIACCHAMENYGLKRILVLDWDIHHGNGTQETFYNDSRVLYVSLHRYDNGAFYPGGPGPAPEKIGGENARGYNMNIAWNQTHKKDGDYLAAFTQLILPVVQEFDPELVYISAGFDSGQGDPLGLTDVTPEGYSRMTHFLSNFAGGKVIVSLEGGYKLSTVSEGMKCCTSVLLGEPPLSADSTCRVATSGGMKSILESIKHICPYWNNLSVYKQLFSFLPENTELIFESLPEPDISPFSLDKTREQIEEFKSPCIGMNISGRLAGDEVDEEMEANASAHRKEPVKVNDNLFAVQPRLWCPHLEEMVKPVTCCLQSKPTCKTCGDDSECWYCLSCYEPHCSRYVKEHMLTHGIDSSHLVALSMSDLSVWCYGCDDYVHNEALLAAKSAGHIAKFGEPEPAIISLEAVQE